MHESKYHLHVVREIGENNTRHRLRVDLGAEERFPLCGVRTAVGGSGPPRG